jgi:signal peptidase I
VTPVLVLVASLAVLVAAAFVVRRRVFAVAIVGQSMTPTYRDGERVLAVRTRSVGPGDVVVFTMPTAGLSALAAGGEPPITVKRVTEASPGGPVVVAGDAPRSVDSSIFGPVDRDLIIGRVLRPRRRPA